MIDPLKAIKCLIDKAGSQKAAAKELGISEPHLCDILNGRRSVSGELAKSLASSVSPSIGKWARKKECVPTKKEADLCAAFIAALPKE